MTSLSSVATLRSGHPFRSADWQDQGVPVIKIANIKGGRVLQEGCGYVSEDVAASVSQWMTRDGDLLISMTGYVGEVALIRPGERYLINQRVGRFEFRSDSPVRPEFLFYYLQVPEVRIAIEEMARGSAQPNLSARDASNLLIPVLPKHVQDAIIEVGRALDDRMDGLRQTNITLESIAQALFKSWFVDFDPVHAKVEGREPEGMDTATAALFPSEFEDSELGPVPKGWRTAKLGSLLAVLETGKRPKGGVSGYTHGIPSVGAESIYGIGLFDYSKTRYIPEKFFESMRSGKPRGLEVLLYKDGGKPGEFKPRLGMFGDGFPFERYALNEHVFMLHANEQLSSQAFLYFWLQQERQMDVLRNAGNKAAIPGINRGDVESIQVLVPDQGVVAVFEQTASALIHRILTGAKQSRKLACLRDTLLPRLISGRLRLP